MASHLARTLPLYQWSNPATRDLMTNFTTGLIGERTIPSAVARDNHYNDCELMLAVAAVICGLIADTRTNA